MTPFARLLTLLVPLSLLGATAAGCGDEMVETDEDNNLTKGPNSDQWVYNGTLPHLEKPSIVVSQSAHTVRVSGLLPADFDAAKLPFYAKDAAAEENGRTRIHLVYPIATGSEVNHQPNDYVTERVFPRRTDSSAPWGGFPFISYVNDISSFKGIAFHGPITAEDGDWKLIRGPVSHGCNRMLGEHVVELAHLIGVDMTTRLWPGNTILRDMKIPVKVIRVTDTLNGKNIDVDYPAQNAVKRPKDNVQMFKIWKSEDFPAWVCRVNRKSPPPADNVPRDYCSETMGHDNRFDAVTGPTK
jgi:hypothetical protein